MTKHNKRRKPETLANIFPEADPVEQWFDRLTEIMALAPDINAMPPGKDKELHRHAIMTVLTMIVNYAPPEALEEIEARFPEVVADIKRMKARPQ